MIRIAALYRFQGEHGPLFEKTLRARRRSYELFSNRKSHLQAAQSAFADRLKSPKGDSVSTGAFL